MKHNLKKHERYPTKKIVYKLFISPDVGVTFIGQLGDNYILLQSATTFSTCLYNMLILSV